MEFDFTTLNTGGGVHPFAADRGVTDPNIITFSVAEMRLELAPGIRAGMHRIVDRGSFGYAIPDPDRYFTALTDWMLTRHGWQIRREETVQTGGVIAAIAMAIRAFTEPGDGIIIQTPLYPHFREEIEKSGRVPLENPLICRDGVYTMDFRDLREKAKGAKMLMLCSPHNPTGRVWTRRELEELGEICLETGLYVVSDEIHFDLDFSGAHTVLTRAVPELIPRTVICTAPSKTFNLAGNGLSNIVIQDPDMRERFRQEAGFYVNTFAYAAATAAYETGGPWLDALLAHLRENRRVLSDRLQQLTPGAVLSPLEGTYLQWVDLSCLGLPQQALMELLERARVFVSDGTDFGQAGRGHIRFNLACPTRCIHEAMDRLARAL